nr:MAG TPA: hypothetical protein [Caudoviricetes sp.]
MSGIVSLANGETLRVQAYDNPVLSYESRKCNDYSERK